MRLLFAAALSALTIGAQAQVFLAADPPPCWPSFVGGSGKGFASGGNPDGQWLGGWCELPGEPRGQWRKWAVVALHGYVIQHPGPSSNASAIQLAEAYWRINVALNPVDGADPRRAQLWTTAMTSLDATKPIATPAPRWIVTPAISGSRPLFEVVNGALMITQSRVRALASTPTPCDCAAKLVVKDAVSYCLPAGQTALVAACRLL